MAFAGGDMPMRSEAEVVGEFGDPEVFKMSELVAGSPSNRNWKGTIIALATIFTICGLIAIAILVITPDEFDPFANGTVITLEDLSSKNYSLYISPAGVTRWIPDGSIVFMRDDQTVVSANISNDYKDTVLVNRSMTIELGGSGQWIVSPTKKLLAVGYARKRIYSQSGTFKHVKLHTTNLGGMGAHYEKLITFEQQKIRVFKWSSKSDEFVYVTGDHDFARLWYSAGPKQQAVEIVPPEYRDHVDKSCCWLYVGAPDWLYEEEILHQDEAVWWSKDDSFLAYIVFDDRAVDIMRFPKYKRSMYPEIFELPYPKAGRVIPKASLYVWEKATQTSRPIKPPKDLDNRDFYITNVLWLDTLTDFAENTLIVIWSNRVQNTTYLYACDPTNGITDCVEIHVSRVSNGYIDPQHKMTSEYSSSKEIFAILPRRSKDQSFLHIARLRVSKDKPAIPQFVTDGDFDVRMIAGYDANQNIIYFQARHPYPGDYLYSKNMGDQDSPLTCLTCPSDRNGSDPMLRDCAVSDAVFSKDGRHYCLLCKGPGRPKFLLRDAIADETVRVISNNSNYDAAHSKRVQPTVKFGNVTVEGVNGRYTAYYEMLIPPTYLSTAVVKKSYPMLLKVYAGPNSNAVQQRPSTMSIDTYFAGHENYVVVKIDARGMGNTGSRNRFAVYKALGTAEIQDQLDVARQIEERHDFIRKDSIGVWGWSYGGFATLQLLILDGKKKENKYFKCGAAVAPVTDFALYDAAYTERYMSTPSDNKAGYQWTDITSHDLDALKYSKLLLMHGTGDDNVHFQHTAQLISAMTQRNIPVEMQIYPDENHNVDQRLLHLHTSLINFFRRCFPLEHGDEL